MRWRWAKSIFTFVRSRAQIAYRLVLAISWERAFPFCPRSRAGQSDTIRASLENEVRNKDVADRAQIWWRQASTVRAPLSGFAVHAELRETLGAEDGICAFNET
ncbi:MAG: hypothetical protein ABJM43_00130 [Paracoccaceae bacterium]